MHKVLFYVNGNTGTEEILNWLKSFNKSDRAILGEDLRTAQIGFPLGAHGCRSLRDGLWEVRSTLAEGRCEARMIFYHDTKAKALVVLHGFIKKSQKTPKSHIDLALKRKREFSP